MKDDMCEILQNKLAELEDRYEKENMRNDMLYEIIHSGKWSFFIDASNRIVRSDVSDAANRIIHNTVAADGYSWATIVHPDDRAAAMAAFKATLNDLSCNTPYDVNYRMLGSDGEYRWFHSAGRIVREPDGSGEFFGIHEDITDQMVEQQKRLLGAIPLSSDILTKANIGLWAFELDDGKAPRMYVDEAMLGLIGLEHQVSPEETYHAWYDHIDEDSYDLVNDAVEKMAAGEHAEVQYPWHRPDGSTMIVRCGGVRNPGYTHGIRIEGTHQDVSSVLHFDEEVRQRLKAQEIELVKTRLRGDALKFISDNTPDFDIVMDFFGHRIQEISGCDQVIFRNLEGHRIVINAPGIEDIPQDVCAECPFSDIESDLFRDERIILDDTGEGIYGEKISHACPIKSSFMQRVFSGGKLVGLLSAHYIKDYHQFSDNGIDIMNTIAIYCGLVIDRIEARKAEQEKMQAEASNKAKTEFLFNMSHDIRTPMNAIIGFTDKAIRHKADPRILNESLDKIRASGNYLLGLVNDILDMARIESGKLELKEELCYWEPKNNTLLEVFGADAARKNIKLHTDYETQDKYVEIDETRTNQIIANLLSNAIKYTSPGGDIWFSVEQVASEKTGYGKFIITVRDSGRGMSREFLKRIFDAFERDRSAVTNGEQGTGLGMAIVKKLVEAMGGTIDIQSELNVGTTVSFTTYHRIATPEEIERYDSEHESVRDDREVNFEGRRLLLVEDNELNREIAIDILEDQGILIDEAENGQQAIEILKEKGPDYYDFVLMDIQMPVMGGYEATKRIRVMYPDRRIPIIALSANAFIEDKMASAEAGMDDHVAKPIQHEELFTVLARFIEH